MIKKEGLGGRSTNREERVIYNEGVDEFLNMFVDLMEKHPNIAVENLVTQLAEALTEAKSIMLLREIKKT